MKTIILKFYILVFVLFSQILISQNKKQQTSNNKTNPVSFVITKSELATLLNYKMDDRVKLKSNVYLNGSTVSYKYIAGNVKQLKLKLSYFANADLVIQINADNTRQVFVLSTNDANNYKNKSDKPSDTIVMEKCKKDEIISE